ncbi:hypothetical protein, partial [Weissella confusa]|uniref:hypothetical protein n=1 Tax=Weissella confusa TaxID=1583 RepID=UPI001A7EA010
WLQLVCPFLFLHPKQKKGTNNQSRERVVISTKYFRTHISYQDSFFNQNMLQKRVGVLLLNM